MLKSEAAKIKELEKEVELYQELLELVKAENQILKGDMNKDLADIKSEQRELRDSIERIESKFKISKLDKAKLLRKSNSSKLNLIKPLVAEIYELEKENQSLATSL